MAGAELIGKEEIKEVMDVLETGILMRYGFDKERKGIYKVREFEEAFAKYCGDKLRAGSYFRLGGAPDCAHGNGCRSRRRSSCARFYFFGHL